MPKRKHSELESDTGREGKVNTVKAARLRHKFEHGKQELFRALKTARGFERQKLGRRQKTAKTDGDTKALERLAMEVHVLKALNLEETAERYLHKQLTKTKRILESPEFVQLEKSLASLAATGTRDPAEANVTARLFKSNPVQNALPDLLKDIRTLLGVDEIAKKQPQKQKQQVEEDGEQEADVQKGKTKSTTPDKATNSKDEDDDISMNDVSDGDDDENFGLDLAQFDSRLAPASDASDSEEESSNETNTHYNLADDISISSAEASDAEAGASESEASEFNGFSDSPSQSPPPPEPKAATKKANTTDKPPKDTTFLPSLTMGGYWSGSEDGAEDEIDETVATKPQRKNRMGQQARRALWEKKYGAGANHVKQQQQNDSKKGRNNKNSGWDARRGATDDNSGNNNRSKWGNGNRRDGTGQFDKNNANNTPLAPRDQQAKKAGATASSTGPAALHPSWEAARKAKEQKAQASFSGKKIVFD